MAGMRQVPTITDAEEVIRTQPKIKLPDRRHITLWNSPELGQFRGVSEDLDAEEERRHKAQLEQLEIKKASREGDTGVPDIKYVHEALRANQQQHATMQQHAGIDCAECEGGQSTADQGRSQAEEQDGPAAGG